MVKLGTASLRWALEHAKGQGDTDVFPPAFEYRAIGADWANVERTLSAADLDTWTVRPHRRMLAPKGRYGFRVVTQLDPLDFLMFAAAVRELAPKLEAARVPAAERVVHSFRLDFGDRGRMYSKVFTWKSFQHRSWELSRAESGNTHVVVTDIADFYGRIYLHRLENAVVAASSNQPLARATIRLIQGWNGSETFGIPVGSQPARLLAEVALADVDQALLANGVQFVRYNDDYRLFGTNYEEAFRGLLVLADYLHRNHGLSLNQYKTGVYEAETFVGRFLDSPQRVELRTLEERFRELLSEIGEGNPYGEIELVELDGESRARVEALNLARLFKDEAVNVENVDPALLRFLLRRLAQVGDVTALPTVLERLESLHFMLPDVVEYLKALKDLDADQRTSIGGRLLDVLRASALGRSDYYRLWLLEVFTNDDRWNHAGVFEALLAQMPSPVGRRQLILALGRARRRHWFQAQWRDWDNEGPWPRRALLLGGSCLPADARVHWYKSAMSKLDVLEQAVARYAQANPF